MCLILLKGVIVSWFACSTPCSSKPRVPLQSPSPPSSASSTLSRRLSSPDTLQEPIPLRQSVQAVVSLGTAAHEPAQRVDLVLAGVATVLVNLAHGDLHRGVVFGFDDAVGGGAFAGDVEINDLAFLVLHG